MLAQKNYVTLERGCACVLRLHCTRVLQNGVIVYFIEKKSNLKLVNTTFNWFSGVDLDVDRYYLIFWC